MPSNVAMRRRKLQNVVAALDMVRNLPCGPVQRANAFAS